MIPHLSDFSPIIGRIRRNTFGKDLIPWSSIREFFADMS